MHIGLGLQFANLDRRSLGPAAPFDVIVVPEAAVLLRPGSALALGAEKLIVLTDVEGLYRDWPASGDVISEIAPDELEALVPSLDSGMVPTTRSALHSSTWIPIRAASAPIRSASTTSATGANPTYRPAQVPDQALTQKPSIDGSRISATTGTDGPSPNASKAMLCAKCDPL